MKTAFILAFILLLLSFHSNAQQTIDKLNVNQLKLPKESTNKALILDGAGQVKSSSTITDTELGYLEGLSDTLVNLLSGKANDSDVVKLSGNQSVDGIKTFNGKLVASSTVNGSIPCPVMTEAQRDLFTPVEGDCVYNSDTLKLNVFDGSVWKDVGGAGGISLWLTANPYNVNDIVIESDKIYRCLIAHTSSVFATDLGAGNWGEVSQGLTSPVALADGGTGLSITPVVGSIVYVDADSFEQLSPGSAGQILQSNGSSAPSWVNKSVSMSSENAIPYDVEEIQVPNNLLTETDSNKKLIETGNNNILENPSFESISIGSGWTNSAGALSFDYSVLIHGKRSAKLVLSSETMSLTQSSTLYAAQFADGVQGLASVRVKSDVALKVCAVQAGVVSTSLCVDVQANNKWGLYKVPFILGATSNGISIASTGAVTGTVYIDDAFVGAQDIKQDINNVGNKTSFTATSNWPATLTATYKQIGDTADIEIKGVLTSTPTGQLTITLPASLTFIDDNRGSTSGVILASAFIGGTIYGGSAYLSGGNSISVRSWLANSTYLGHADTAPTIPNNWVSGNEFFISIRNVKIQGWSSGGSIYSSTNADTDMQPWTPTGSWTTNSTYSGKFRRKGAYLFGEVKVSLSGAPNATPLTINLPTYNGSQLFVDTSKYPDFVESRVGSGTALDNLVTRYALRTTILNSTQIQVNAIDDTGAPYTVDNVQVSNTVPFSFNSGDSVSINFMVPVLGWTESNIIIGQFNGLESCSSTLDCTDTFSAKVSAAGVVSDENAEWINGNASKTATGDYTITFNSSIFTVAPNCTALPGAQSATSGSHASTISLSNSSFRYLITQEAGTEFDSTINIICQKQGVDYIGKTAKAVASDQNVRSIGSTGMDIQSVYFGSGANCGTACTTGTCTICSQVGSKITSVTWVSAGNYNLNGIDGTKYICTSNGSTSISPFAIGGVLDKANSSASLTRISFGGNNVANASSTCIGIP